MFKKTIAIVLVLIFSVNSFAAVVSDNDGSAFITKAEFDSLKNDFQFQIDWNNAVQINAGQTEKISFNVKEGDIIFFRFGRVDSATSYTTRSGGQVQIDKIVLERE